MLGSFKKLLIENKSPKEVPKAIVAALNEVLPKGFEYKTIGERCILSPISIDAVKRMKINVNLETSREIIEKHKENLNEYLYRTQTSLPIDNFKVNIDNKEYDISELVKMPINEGDLNDFKGVLVPREFPPANVINLKVIDGKEFNISFRRKPYDDMNVMLIENETLRSLEIKIYYNEITGDVNIKLQIAIEEALCVEELLDALEIFHGFLTSNIEFDGKRLPKGDDSNNDVGWILDSIEFWNKVKYIENEFNLKFIPSKDLSKDDYDIIGELYTCLSKGDPIIYLEPFSYITIGKLSVKSELDFINKPNLCFEFIEEIQIDFLGCKFKLFSATMLEDFVITNVKEIDDGESRVYIKSEDGKKTKLSRMFFKNAEQARVYQENKHIQGKK